MWFISMRRYSNSATNVNGLLHEFLHGKEVSYIYMQKKTPKNTKRKKLILLCLGLKLFVRKATLKQNMTKGV